MITFIEAQFVPVKVHIKEQPDTFKRFGAQWTPVLVVFDPDGKEQHRWEGYLPPEDFLGQLELAFAKEAFAAERWEDAADRIQKVADEHPATEYGPLALYYAGVARYKAGDHEALADTARALRTRHAESSWAKKSSVWLPAEDQGAAP